MEGAANTSLRGIEVSGEVTKSISSCHNHTLLLQFVTLVREPAVIEVWIQWTPERLAQYELFGSLSIKSGVCDNFKYNSRIASAFLSYSLVSFYTEVVFY